MIGLKFSLFLINLYNWSFDDSKAQDRANACFDIKYCYSAVITVPGQQNCWKHSIITHLKYLFLQRLLAASVGDRPRSEFSPSLMIPFDWNSDDPIQDRGQNIKGK